VESRLGVFATLLRVEAGEAKDASVIEFRGSTVASGSRIAVVKKFLLRKSIQRCH
jgi:urease beta subunit